MAEAFVYDHIRTPRGKGKAAGSLHEVKPVDLAVGLLQEVRRRNPGLDPASVKRVLISTAERLPSYEVDRQGWGVLDARRAVERALSLR